MKQTIELPVGELKTALAGLGKIINARSPLPALGCARLSRGVSGGVTLSVTDLDSFASFRFNVPDPGPFKPVLVPFSSLAAQAKGRSGGDRLEIVAEGEKRAFRFDLGGTRVEQPFQNTPVEEWPTEPVLESTEITVGQTFKDSMREAFDCASEESSRYVLGGVFVDVSQPEAHYLIGCDGRTLYSANSFALDLPGSVILPRRKFLQWAGFVEDGDWRVAVLPSVEKPAAKAKDKPSEKEGDKPEDKPIDKPVEFTIGWARVCSSRWSLTTKLVGAEYPNWRQVVPNTAEYKTTIRFSPEAAELLQSVLPKLPGNETVSQSVQLVVRPGSFVVLGRAEKSLHLAEVPIPGVEVTGEPNETTVNREYLLRALGFGLRQLLLHDNLTPLVFIDGGRKFVAMPMRSGGESTPAAPAQNNPPPEAAESANPSANQPNQPPTEESENTMSTTPKSSPQPQLQPAAPVAPVPQAPEAEENASPFKAAVAEVEKAKESLRAIITSLNSAMGLLRSAEREQKASNKEIESVRAKLREIQNVKI